MRQALMLGVERMVLSEIGSNQDYGGIRGQNRQQTTGRTGGEHRESETKRQETRAGLNSSSGHTSWLR